MKLLFIHHTIPGQFKFLLGHYGQDEANEVVFLCHQSPQVTFKGVRVIQCTPQPMAEGSNPIIHEFTQGAQRATAFAQSCAQLKESGFVPDVVIAHSGWGDGFFVKAVFPDVPLLNYMEFFFHEKGRNLNYEIEDITNPTDRAKLIAKNAPHLLNFHNADWCITPTLWQRSVHPDYMHSKMTVLHEGVNTDICAPMEREVITLPNGLTLHPQQDEIITHVESNFDHYRGFHKFLDAAEIIQSRRPNAHIIVAGRHGAGYGNNWPDGRNSQQILEAASLDNSRIHFVGTLDYAHYLKLLQSSSAHIYMTYPYVLSWSFMEAMSVGCPLVCSKTPPIEEMVSDSENCRMFDFFDPSSLADAVDAMLDDRDAAKALGLNARKVICDHYDINDILPLYTALIEEMAISGAISGARSGQPVKTAKIIAERSA